MLADGQMLGAVLFAQTAFDALRCLSVEHSQIAVIDAGGHGIVALLVIIHGKVIGDHNVLGAFAFADTVAAGGAGNGNTGANNPGSLVQHFQFRMIQRLEVLHVAYVILHLLHSAHSGEHHHDILRACRKADGPGSDGQVGAVLFQNFTCRLRKVRQHTALDGFHDDNRFSVGSCHLVALLGPDTGILQVQIVQLKLDILHLGVVSQNLFQQFRGIVEGEADVFDLPFCLLLRDEFKGLCILHLAVITCRKRVEPIVIEKLHAAALQLLIKNGLQVFFLVHQIHGHFIRDSEGISGIALHHYFPECLLRETAMVGVGCIKVGTACCDKGICHLLEFIQVHLSIGIAHSGKPHQTKTKFFHIHFPFCYSLLFAQAVISASLDSAICPRTARPETTTAPLQYFFRSRSLEPISLPSLVHRGISFLPVRS